MPLKTEEFLPFSSIHGRFDFDELITEIRYLLFKDARVSTANFAGGLYLIDENIQSFDLQYEWNLEEELIGQCYEFSTNTREAELIAAGRRNTRVAPNSFTALINALRKNSNNTCIRVWPLVSRNSIFGCIWILAENEAQLPEQTKQWIGNLTAHIEGICY